MTFLNSKYFRVIMKLEMCSMICVVLMLDLLSEVVMDMQLKEYKEVMKTLSYSFGLNLLECGDTVNATATMARDIHNYWNVSYELTHPATGCLVLCSMAKLELLDNHGQLMKANAEGYVRANGADDKMVVQLMKLFTKCRGLPFKDKHPCAVALEMSTCFRGGVRDLNWTPDVTSLFV